MATMAGQGGERFARGDVAAGLSVAALMLPEAVAYAGIAGLSPARGLLAGVVGCLAYLALGRSRFAIVSATSSSAAILAAALATLAPLGAYRDALATIVILMVGAAFLLAALLRLGALAGFVSRPVLRGFAFGLAITIVLRQVPTILGLHGLVGDVATLTLDLVHALPRTNAASLLAGLAALAGLFLLRRWPALPGALIVLAAGIAASVAFDLPAHGVAVVGSITVALSMPQLPHLDGAALMRVAQLTAPLVLILFAESWGTIRTLALRHGDTVRPDRELAGLGVANLAAGLVQGMPVGAGFSAGSANEAAGAGSRWAAAIAGVALAALVIVARPLIAHLPEPVLAAVVVAALSHALDPAPLVRLFRLRRDMLIGTGAVIGVLALGVVNGMLLAILLSIASFLHRASTPAIARLGQLGDSHDFVSLERHPDARVPPGMTIWRAGEPLFFANAERVLSTMAEQTPAGTRIVVVSLEDSFDLDSTALDALVEFDRTMAARGAQLRLARVRDHVRDLFRAAGAQGLEARSFYSVADAAAATIAAKEPVA
ncbi:SulP family inorganic anion transporter [Sphingomonas azotifigens]|uniref:SulP family inorganic anion transporter n=1 Tax=Sphingomonas azotifigens TaxID=330920 RepID=UPI001FEA974B|nr:SulP family inorganic anion transporter [Sphingomonas azotifigens]